MRTECEGGVQSVHIAGSTTVKGDTHAQSPRGKTEREVLRDASDPAKSEKSVDTWERRCEVVCESVRVCVCESMSVGG